jgi:endonuclease/exonuclease/phosphatase family metal-dependent hydrolase
VVVLQEVESEAALLALRDRSLRGLGYRHAVFARGPAASPSREEPRVGVVTSVGVLSRLRVVRSRLYDPGRFQGSTLRPILEVELELGGRTLTVFNSHWKSKIGGVEATEAGRRLTAATLVRRLRVMLAADPRAEVVVAGDLNLNLEELAAPGQPLLPAAAAAETGLTDSGVRLYDPWYELAPAKRGSAVYAGRWQTPDHFLLAPGLLDEEGFQYRPGDFRVVRLPFLVHLESGFPRRFDPAGSPAAERADPGCSDHLPLLLEIVLAR